MSESLPVHKSLVAALLWSYIIYHVVPNKFTYLSLFLTLNNSSQQTHKNQFMKFDALQDQLSSILFVPSSSRTEKIPSTCTPGSVCHLTECIFQYFILH